MVVRNRTIVGDWELRLAEGAEYRISKAELLEQLCVFVRDLCTGDKVNLPESFILHGIARTPGRTESTEINLSQITIERGDYNKKWLNDLDPIDDGDFIITTSSGDKYVTTISLATMETQLFLTALRIK